MGTRPHVIILGAGFGGLACARALAGRPVAVTLVDRNNYHLFTPLLYQVASSLLNPSDIAIPVRSIFRRKRNIRILRTEVTSVLPDPLRIRTAEQEEIAGDYLVLATGSRSRFFGLDSVEREAFGLKDLPEAMQLRNHVLCAFEEAAKARDAGARRRWMTFVVVGAGPTGVEYAGALSELVRLVLVKDFPELDMKEVRVVLVELGDRVLPAFQEPLSAYALTELAARGIEVRLGTGISEVEGRSVRLADGTTLQAETVVWAAGVGAAELRDPVRGDRSRSGRLRVDEYLRVPGLAGVFAIGDVASFTQDGLELPMVAPPAMQQGRHVAKTILRLRRGESAMPFRYRDKGIMATIGRKAAVAESGSLRFTGLMGWLAWLVLHLIYIISFRNRFVVLLTWAWEYFRYDRPVRLIARARERDGRDRRHQAP